MATEIIPVFLSLNIRPEDLSAVEPRVLEP